MVGFLLMGSRVLALTTSVVVDPSSMALMVGMADRDMADLGMADLDMTDGGMADLGMALMAAVDLGMALMVSMKLIKMKATRIKTSNIQACSYPLYHRYYDYINYSQTCHHTCMCSIIGTIWGFGAGFNF